MHIKPIRDDDDYNEAIRRIEVLWQAADGSPQSDELDVLATLVDEYENKKFPIDDPDPIEAIKFRLEQLGLTTNDLVPTLGSKSVVDEIIERRRALDLTMIRKLNSQFQIPAEILIKSYSFSEEGTTF